MVNEEIAVKFDYRNMIAESIQEDLKRGVAPKTIQVMELVKYVLEENKPKGFMIGQRVIYQNVICTVCTADHNHTDKDCIWIDNPERGYRHWVAEHNVQPLPGGQL